MRKYHILYGHLLLKKTQNINLPQLGKMGQWWKIHILRKNLQEPTWRRYIFFLMTDDESWSLLLFHLNHFHFELLVLDSQLKLRIDTSFVYIMLVDFLESTHTHRHDRTLSFRWKYLKIIFGLLCENWGTKTH